MKTFRQFINERVNYHIARGGEDPMEHKDRPIWFAHDKKLKTGIHAWYSTAKKLSKKAPDIYQAKIKGKIAHHGDPKVKKIIHDNTPTGKSSGEYQQDFHHTINHKYRQITKHRITKALQKHGYVGYRHPELKTGKLPIGSESGDYPHEATMVFNRKHVSLKKHGPSAYINTPKAHREQLQDIDHWRDITHTYPIHKRMAYRKHNVKVYKNIHGHIRTIKKDTGELHSVNDEPSLTSSLGRHWYKNGQLHRDGDKPADISSDGDKSWYKNGQLHRDGDKPAYISSDGDKRWYKNGQLHRDGDKPADISIIDGNKSWYKNGQLHRDGDKPADIWPHNKRWYKNGQLHRDGDKPAVTRLNGEHEYYRNGEQYQPKEKKQQ